MPDPIDLEPMQLTDERLSDGRLRSLRKTYYWAAPLCLVWAVVTAVYAPSPWNVYGTWIPLFLIGMGAGAAWPRYWNTIPD